MTTSSITNARREPTYVKWMLIGSVVIFISIFLIIPLTAVFIKAFEQGINLYFAAIVEPDALHAIKLTLIVLIITVPLNMVFGITTAWLIAKFKFRGKNLLLALIDIPFAVSPVIAGLIFILLFSNHGLLGPLLEFFDIEIVFALPGIVLATLFVTFPFISRELIPLMQAQGTQEEEAALILGASGWQMFRKVTLPNIKWGLLYGIILCSARTIGEFGAVSVVSGHIRGLTNTMPLHIEILYNEYQFQATFAIASLMSIVAIITLILQTFLDKKYKHEKGGV